MAKFCVCLCLILCVQYVVGQFGFFPARESNPISQIGNFLNPTRIRNRLSGILHLQHETPNQNQYVYPFDNRPNGRPGIINYNQFNGPYQNQEVPNQNQYQERPNQNQDVPNPNQYQERPNQNQDVPYPNQYQERPNQNQDVLNPNQNQEKPNQNQDVPNPNQYQEKPNQNQDVPNPNQYQEIPNQNQFQEAPNTPANQENGNDGLIVIPATIGNAFGTNNDFAFPGATAESRPEATTEPKVPNPNQQQEVPNHNQFQEAPNKNGFTVAEYTPSLENQENGNDGLIVIPATVGNTVGTNNDFAFPGPTEATTAPVTEESTQKWPPLTPVPSTDSRNNFNFGPAGIFQETCQTVQNELGSCIPISQCVPYMKLVKEARSNSKALTLLRQAHCGFQGDEAKVCCPRPAIPTNPITSPPPTQPTQTTPHSGAVIMPTEPTQPEAEPKTVSVTLPEAPVCGVSNASFSRVVGGVNAKLGDFPWMALLGYKERRGGAGARWLCGGSLISQRHVLTAAHCIHTREEELYVVRLGELDLAREDEGAAPIDVLIKHNIKHEEYNPKSFTNDIGILVLSRNVVFTGLVRPICIPRSSELRSRDYENYNPLIAGWGDTEFRGPAATHLQVLQLPVVSNDFCAQAYSAYKAQVIDHRVLCAGYKKGGKDACQGDSGGPLMQPIWNSETLKTYFYQIGVVSYGKKCAEAGFPGVYTRVTNFVPWIEDTVAKN